MSLWDIETAKPWDFSPHWQRRCKAKAYTTNTLHYCSSSFRESCRKKRPERSKNMKRPGGVRKLRKKTCWLKVVILPADCTVFWQFRIYLSLLFTGIRWVKASSFARDGFVHRMRVGFRYYATNHIVWCKCNVCNVASIGDSCAVC